MLLLQDNERAFFDSADWALCKVFYFILLPNELKELSEKLKMHFSNIFLVKRYINIWLFTSNEFFLSLKMQQGAGVNQKSAVAIETLRPKLQVMSSSHVTLLDPTNDDCTRNSGQAHHMLVGIMFFFWLYSENSSSAAASSKTSLYILKWQPCGCS